MTQFLGPTMALTMSTIAFTICFACWVLNGVLITYLVNTNIFAFTTAEVGWLLAVPFLTGSISRLPLGVLTDRYGGRTVFFWLMIASAVPLYLVSHARGFGDLLWAGAGFGLTGGGFAVGVGYVAAWFSKQMQGTALGIFGMGNAGAALNTMVTPSLLIWLTDTGADPEHWRQLPRLYAAVLVLVAMLFFVLTKDKRPESASGTGRTTLTLLAPLADIRVWRFGLYYFLVFGAFVAIAQWLVPYSVNVYGISIVQAGFIASLFSFPSGVIRAAGGWLSDRFGARTVMYWSFMSCAVSCAFLAVPRMEIVSPGFGVTAAAGGAVTAVSPTAIGVGARTYALKPPVETLPARTDTGDMVWLSITRWHEPVVKPGETVVQGQLLARGVTNIYYPANIWLFVFAVTVFGIATGIAKAGVYKFIPDYYPESVGLVGGIIGMIGALGGFVLPPVFGYLMGITGVWATCWLFLTLVSLTCLWWMQYTIRSILKAEAPNLTQLVEFRPRTAILKQEPAAASEATTVEGLLRQVPIFSHLTPEELKSLAGIGRLQTVEAQTILLREGDAGDSSFLLLRGTVDVFRTAADGHDIVIATLKAGEIFGELALIDGEPRSASARAVETCDLFVIARADFIKLLSTSPRVLGDVMVGLSARIRQSNAEHFNALLEKERLRNQGELERHRMITQMVAGIAHEVNTPVGVANHAASLLGEQLAADRLPSLAKDEAAARELADSVEAARLIQNNLARADALIKAFKKLSAHQASEAKTPVELLGLTKEIVGLYAIKARAAKIEIAVNGGFGNGDGTWDGYPGVYSQVLLNLLQNVDRYAYPEGGGRVEVDVGATAGGGFRVSVRDFGRGIPDADLAKVWDPFFTTGRAQGGSGLGLAIVQNQVTSTLGGRVGIDSAVGRGTTVWFEFPKSAPAPAAGGTG